MAEKEVKGIKKFFEEFKAFAMRGNVLDMAVGVVIGGAFTAIVNSLVNDIINPAIGLFFNADFSEVGIHVGDDGKLCGDVRFAEAEPVVEAITPVPGGVGTVTTSVLVGHVVQAAAKKAGL